MNMALTGWDIEINQWINEIRFYKQKQTIKIEQYLYVFGKWHIECVSTLVILSQVLQKSFSKSGKHLYGTIRD